MTLRTLSARTLLAVLLLATATVACSDDSDDSGSGGSTLEFSDDRVIFTVPDRFERTDAGAELISGVEVEFLDDPTGDRPLPEQIHLRYAVPDDPNFSIQAWPAFAIGPMLGDDEMTERDEVEVTGAGQALRVEFRLHYDELDEPVRMVALGAIVDTPDGPVVADLRYLAVESEFDPDTADSVMESLRGGT